MKVLLVGAGGFLGGAVDRALLARDHRPTRVVGPGGTRAPGVFPYYPGLYGEPGFRSELDAADAVIYAAGRVLPRDGRDLRRAWETDCVPLVELCAAAAGRERPLPTLLLSSGGAVYGLRDRDTRLTETSPTRPVSVYGQSRVFLEQILGLAGRAHHADGGSALRPTIFRLSNLYGPGQDPNGGSAFIVRALRAAAGGPALPLMGSGRQEKDFLYLDDFTAAVGCWLEAIGPPDCAGDAAREPWDDPRFNICSGQSHTLRQVLDAVAEVAGRPVPVEPMPGVDEDIPRVHLSPDKALRELAWEARVPLAEGLRRFWRAGVGREAERPS